MSERRLLTREDAIRETINSPECLGYVKDLNDLQRKYLEATK